MTYLERFMTKTLPPDANGCINWNATLKHGYGWVSFRGVARGAHRVAWILKHGDIQGTQQVCHHCDNPRCVNADHLFLGSARDNSLDALSKGRLRANRMVRSTHCSQGHPWDYIYPDGQFGCKRCQAELGKNWRRGMARFREFPKAIGFTSRYL